MGGGGGGTPTPDDTALGVLRAFFESLGMVFDAELEALVVKFMKAGYGPEDIGLMMPDLIKTKAFQDRFPGYSARIANGYNAIDIGRYLDLEDQYHSILAAAGLPKGFYDDHNDFADWIANDVSPDEIRSRVDLAVKASLQVDPTVRNLLAKFYGLSTGDVAAYFLDRKRGLQVLEHQFETAGVASWASRNGLDVSNAKRYEDLVDAGITTEQAAQAYGTIRQFKDTFSRISGVYGEAPYTQTEAENDVFFGRDERRRKLTAQEQATFHGSSNGATGSAQRQRY